MSTPTGRRLHFNRYPAQSPTLLAHVSTRLITVRSTTRRGAFRCPRWSSFVAVGRRSSTHWQTRRGQLPFAPSCAGELTGTNG